MQVHELKIGETLPIPLVGALAKAGFPSPADDFLDAVIDLNELLILRPAATYMIRVGGDSMINAGLDDGDVMIVDRSEDPVHGDIVIALVDGGLTVKRLYHLNGVVRLISENELYPNIDFTDGQEMDVWGVVRNVIKMLK